MIAIFIKVYFSIGLVANFVLFLIQAWRLYKAKDSEGLSFITFFGFNLIQLSTILYGILTKDLFLTIGYILSFMACLITTILIPHYRKKRKSGGV